MKYVVIDPKARTIKSVDVVHINDAVEGAGLQPGAVDYGSLANGLGYVVYEFGHFVPCAEQHYFSIGRTLVSGTAVLYHYDEAGNTLDLLRCEVPDVRFYLGANDVEAHIQAGEIERPYMGVNGVVHWQWPQPRKIPR